MSTMTTAAAFDFSNLTEAQQQVLSAGGWDLGRGKQPRPGTMRKLIERDLVVPRERAFMGIRVPVYDVPEAVGVAWREHRAATNTPAVA